MLRDESFHPLEFDHHLFFNKDSKNLLPSSWITSHVHPIIERVSFLCSSFSSCLSCLSCLSMFPNAANRLNGTWSLLPKGHKGPLFHSRMIRTAGRGPDLSETKPVSLSNDPSRRGGRGLDSRANGSFPKGARRLSEKSPGAHPPPHQPSPGGSASATPPQGGSDCPGSAGVPPASCPFGRR